MSQLLCSRCTGVTEPAGDIGWCTNCNLAVFPPRQEPDRPSRGGLKQASLFDYPRCSADRNEEPSHTSG